MNFNKRDVFRFNLAAIKEAFRAARNKTEPDPAILNGYKGYGGLKEILLDPYSENDWNKTNNLYKEHVLELHEYLKEYFGNQEHRYDRCLNSLKASTLTTYYTGQELIDSILESMVESGVLDPQQETWLLEPAAGKGDFITRINKKYPDNKWKMVAVEKEPMSAYIGSKISPDATWISGGFEDADQLNKLHARKKYDVIVSNIPFGNIRVFDPVLSRSNSHAVVQSQNQVHNYFFTKGLEKLKPGGVMVYITSTGVMDSETNYEIRKHILSHAEIISSSRLPNNSFVSAGTKVTSDVLVLRKRLSPVLDIQALPEKQQDFVRNSSIVFFREGEPYDFSYNKMVDHNEERVLGEFKLGWFNNKPSLTVEPVDESVIKVPEELKTAMLHDLQELGPTQSINDDVTQSTASVERNKVQGSPTLQTNLFESTSTLQEDELIDVARADEPDSFLEGELFIYENIPGQLVVDPGSGKTMLDPSKIDASDIDKVRSIIEIRNTYNQLIDQEGAGIQSDMVREELNDHYDRFVEEHGRFHSPENVALISMDPQGFKVLSLSRRSDKGEWVKADILQNSTFAFVEDLEFLSNGPEDAIVKSMNDYGKVDINYVSRLLERPVEEIKQELMNNGMLFPSIRFPADFDFVSADRTQYQNVTFGHDPVTKDDFLSGSINYKLEYLQSGHADYYLEKYDLKKDALEDVLKEVAPPFLSIDLIDVKLGERWIDKSIYEQFATKLFEVPTRLSHLKSTDSWKIELSKYSQIDQQYFHIKCINNHNVHGKDIFLHALMGTKPHITYTRGIGDGKKTFIDHDAMNLVEERIKEVNIRFKKFILSDQVLSDHLAAKYNALFNREVKRMYSGEHMTYPGLQYFDPRSHQNDCVWMQLQTGGGYADHEVGAGKTLFAIMLAMEYKRLGIRKKTMITALKANSVEIAAEFKKAYPDAKVLYPKKSDFTPKKRKALFQNMMNNDWDAIILTHEQFGMIPQSHKMQIQIIEEEMANISADLQVMLDGKRPDKRILKGLEQRKMNKGAKLQELLKTMRKDPNMVTFDKMGIDHLIVDEAHCFKNLEYSTRHSRVAGLSPEQGSKRAANLLVACRTLQNKHGGDEGITFMSGTSISNSLVEMYLIQKYLIPTKLKECGLNSFDAWARSFTELSRDYEQSITGEITQKDRFRKFQKVPELAALYNNIAHVINEHNLNIDKPEKEDVLIDIEPSDEQNVFIDNLIRAIKTEDFSLVGKDYDSRQIKAKMLLAANLSAQMAIDMRILDPDKYDIGSGSKLPIVADRIASEYGDSEDYKGTQLVFCDLSTPGSKTSKGFNVYDGLKNILVEEYGLPEEEIQFIHDHQTDKAKVDLREKVNDGQVRIVIGSTSKLGTGTNYQNRCVALHHIDIQWTPKSDDQRVGRGVRQGNWVAKEHRANKVKNYYYATKRTLDSFKYFVVDLKRKFIDQVKNGTVKSRIIDEGDMGEDGVPSMAAFIARLSGNEELLQKAKIDRKLLTLTRLQDALEQDHIRYTSKVKSNSKRIEKLKSNVAQLENHWSVFHVLCAEDNNGQRKAKLTVEGQEYADHEKISGLLKKKVGHAMKTTFEGSRSLAEMGAFELRIRQQKDYDENYESFTSYSLFVQHQEDNVIHKFGDGLLKENSDKSNANYMINALNRIPRTKAAHEADIVKLENEIEVFELRLDSINLEEYKGQISFYKEEAKRLEQLIEQSHEPEEPAEFKKEVAKNGAIEENEIKRSPGGSISH